MKLVLATRNAHKLEEIRSIFNFEGLEVLSAFDFPEIPDVVEDGDTLEANAQKKATEIAKATGLWALADDSGLEVSALNGAPGVYSARYAGEACCADANNEKILSELDGAENRSAQFRTVMALSNPAGEVRVVEGKCIGSLRETLTGEGGFGYDPLFVPEGYEITFAEMGSEKNLISHRARALQAAQREWSDFFEQ